MRKFVLSATLLASAAIAAPAQAVIVAPGTPSIVVFDPFSNISATQGTQIAFTSVSDQTETFAATMLSAVYRNDLGTLDFYYQVYRTGPGTIGNDEISGFSASNFAGFTVDAFVSGPDPDGAGAFGAINNPTPMGGSSTRVGRSNDGGQIRTNFVGAFNSQGNLNGLIGTENSATYIFRTNATRFTRGTFGIIDGSTLDGFAFQPNAVPEPAAWLMMIGGFGMVGGALRARGRKMKTVTA